jgi:hypothetical protein
MASIIETEGSSCRSKDTAGHFLTVLEAFGTRCASVFETNESNCARYVTKNNEARSSFSDANLLLLADERGGGDDGATAQQWVTWNTRQKEASQGGDSQPPSGL